LHDKVNLFIILPGFFSPAAAEAEEPAEAADGSVYPENEPARVNAYNRLLRSVAARSGGRVTLIALNRILDPGGHYTRTVGGVAVRFYDGVHLTVAGGEWLQPRILPEIARLGLEDTSGPVSG
jgi:hypothetical protein